MITTVTLNAAIDRTVVVPNFLVGRRHRASESLTLPGGKGVTIARALKRLGYPVIATGLAGGIIGSNIVERLTNEGILNDFVRIGDPSRASTAVIDPVSGSHTEINEYGPVVTEQELNVFFEKIQYLARASRCVVLAGSLPRNVGADTYQRLVRTLNGLGVTTVVTAPDDPLVLNNAMAAEPSITVVEQREAEAVAGHEFSGSDDFTFALDVFGRMGSRTAVITHEEGCYARFRDGRTVTYHRAAHPPLERVSQLGGTDVFVAGMLTALLDESTAEEQLQRGLGAELANMRVLGAGVFHPNEAQRLARTVTVSMLEPAET